jgi:hypothetical protein
MIGHVSDDRMVDLLEERGTPVEWAHVAGCQACRGRLEEARGAAALVAGIDVPEPPGLYWEALRRNVSRRIGEEPSDRRPWGWVLPLAAAVAAVVVIGLVLPERPPVPTRAAASLPAWSALPPVDADEGLAAVSGFADADGASLAWELDEGRGLGAFVASLSDEESEALVEALRVEGPGGER